MKKAEYALFAYSALVFVQRFSGLSAVQNAAQLSQQGCLVFGAESAVQQFGQGFFLQTAPAFGFAAGQNGHKGNAVCSGCLGIAMASPTMTTLRLSYPQASMEAMEFALLPTSWPKITSAWVARP